MALHVNVRSVVCGCRYCIIHNTKLELLQSSMAVKCAYMGRNKLAQYIEINDSGCFILFFIFFFINFALDY